MSISPRIVARLRLVFAAISLVVISSIIVGYVQLVAVDRASHRLEAQSIPVLETAQSLERNLQSLLSSLQQVGLAATQDRLIPLGDQLAQHLLALRGDIERLSQSGSSDLDAQGLSTALRNIEDNARAVVKTRTELISQRQRLNAQISQIEGLRESTRKILEDLSYESPANFAPELNLDQPLDQAAMNQIEQRYYQNLLQANILTELSLELESISDTADRMTDELSPQALQRIERSVRQKTRAITGLLSQMPQSDARLQLARLVSDMRTIMLGQDAAIERATHLGGLRRSVSDLLARQLLLIQEISDISNALSGTAKDQVDRATLVLAEASRKLELTLAFGSLATLGFLLAASILIVERQINRRMSQLTHSVLTIADGQTDFRVEVSGPDELGDIANALEIFKSNAEELRRSNVELQQFAYVAAHDLRSPLRAIQDLAEWTLEDEENALSEDSRQNLDLLLARTRRLSLLLNDLLEYARVGRDEEHLSEVSIRALVEEVATLLDPDGAYRVTYTGNDIVVSTFATPVQQVLMNLVSNSIKHHDRDHGEILISAHLVGDRIRFSVKDDGAGIPPKYHNRIFGLFQTLKPRDEVEGSGLGLAIIRKLVERYAGQISIISDPEVVRGTEFVFDLPHGLYFSEPTKRAA